MAKKKIKVNSNVEQALIDTMNENIGNKNCSKKKVEEVASFDPLTGEVTIETVDQSDADSNRECWKRIVDEIKSNKDEDTGYASACTNVETEDEVLCDGKGCVYTSEPEVLKPIEKEIPIDYVDTSKPYEPILPEPELYVNEDNRDSRVATTIDTTKDELIKSKDIAKEIIEHKPTSKFDYYTHIINKFPELRDEFCKKVIPISKDLCNRLDEICKPLESQCGSTNGKTIAIYGESPDKHKVALEEQILKCLDIMRGNSTDAPADDKESTYENVNHPNHYNTYDVEVIDMMERIWGPEKTAIFCELNAFKYRMRMGTKPTSPVTEDLEKEIWYLNKMKELKDKSQK
jgi:hypothetical protein